MICSSYLYKDTYVGSYLTIAIDIQQPKSLTKLLQLLRTQLGCHFYPNKYISQSNGIPKQVTNNQTYSKTSDM